MTIDRPHFSFYVLLSLFEAWAIFLYFLVVFGLQLDSFAVQLVLISGIFPTTIYVLFFLFAPLTASQIQIFPDTVHVHWRFGPQEQRPIEEVRLEVGHVWIVPISRLAFRINRKWVMCWTTPECANDIKDIFDAAQGRVRDS
ncbi:MAG: hypothetical protein AAF108_08025 [Planctomycetota bacterium]